MKGPWKQHTALGFSSVSGLGKDSTGCWAAQESGYHPFERARVNPSTTLFLLDGKRDREGRTLAARTPVFPIYTESKNWDSRQRELFYISLNSEVQNINISKKSRCVW